ncbi:MAG: arsenite methyltransferase [Mycobacterium sp.]|jgi:SAM-dependent methyltransferase|nr:arsenite methyltransferase [Mycobacterium sp.]
MAGIAKQLGHPRGVGGRIVGRALNRGNRGFVRAAVQALQAEDDAVVADVGFGGGVGLQLLLDGVDRSGRVHGVEVSNTMLEQAARRYRRDVAAGRLALHSGSLTRLPFADGTFNGVVTVNTIYFVAELQEAFTELARVTAHSGRIVVGIADPETMAKLPFTGHGFHLRPIPEIINALRGAGFTVQHRRVSAADGAPHLLIGTPAPTQA